MNDDFSNLEDMLLDNSSIEEIANEISKELFSSDLYSIESYDFEINEPAIQEYLFSNEITLDQPIAIESGDSIIFMAYDRLEEPYLKTFQDVAEDTADYLSESKAIEKISLLQEEILENSENLDFLIFLDIGNVWGVDYFNGDDEGNEIRSSTGIGIDWLTPVGPLNFTFSTALTKADSDKTETFRFQLGTTF